MSHDIWWVARGARVTAAVAAAALSLGAAGQPALADGARIGALLPLTGDLQAYGQTSLNGINLAVEQINAAGGVLGAPLEVVVGDTQTAAQPSIDAAQKLVSVEGVFGIVGAMSSGNTIPVARSVTSGAGVAQLSNASTSPVITTLEDNDVLFRTIPSDAFQGVALAEIVVEAGYGTVAVLYVNNDYGEGLAESFAAAFEAKGGTVGGSAAYEQGNASYRGELAQLAGAEALVLIGYPENGITILRQALEEGFFNRFIFTDGMKAPEIIDAIGAAYLAGAIGTVPMALTDTPGAERFVAAYEARFGDLPPKPFIDTAYDATMLLALAAEQAGSADPAAVQAALRTVANAPGTEVYPGDWAEAVALIAAGEDINYVGASGSLEFDASGDVSGTFGHWAIEGGEIVTVKVFEPAS